MAHNADRNKDAKANKDKAASKAGWVVVVFMLAVIGGLIAYNPEFVTDLFSGKGEPEQIEVIQGGETTGMGFLTVEGGKGLVFLDGEKIGPLPLANRVIRSGRHRLLIKGAGGKVLLDEKFELAAGDKKSIQIGATKPPANP